MPPRTLAALLVALALVGATTSLYSQSPLLPRHPAHTFQRRIQDPGRQRGGAGGVLRSVVWALSSADAHVGEGRHRA